MKLRNKTNKIISILLLLVLSACQNLDIEYENFPNVDIIFSDPENVYNVISGGFFHYYMANTSSLSPRMSMWVMADHGTCSWANSGMLDLSSEPRMAFNNDVTYTYASIFETYYEEIYQNLAQVNDVLRVINAGMEIGDDGENTEMVKANSYFIQGLSLGYLGLVYDKVYIVTDLVDKDNVESITTSSYEVVIDSALSSLEKCIEVCENNSFTTPGDWFSGPNVSNEQLAQLAHSYAARFLVYKSRNANQNELTDWQAVYDHANAGIQADLAPFMDNVKWINWFLNYTIRPDWAKIDLRIIHLMDPSYPWRYPEDGTEPSPRASSEDARLESDFNYVSVINMKPERGYYHYSNYEYSRIDYKYITGVNTGELVEFSLEENNLFKAEALARLDRLPEAIDIINNGSRITRGLLNPLPDESTESVVLDAIFYERDIELIATGFGIAFFDMRRRDMLQEGTMLHFPIPAKYLMLEQEDIYTYGGIENADGINVSNGGWFPEE